MVSPQKGKPLILYLTSTARSIGALLAQEIEGVEKPVYYISRKVQGAEERYTPIERHCLALVFTAQKLRHYFLSFKVQLVTRNDPMRYLLSRPMLNGRAARWLLALAEFDIECTAPRAIKCQALVDLLAQFPSGECEPLKETLGNSVGAGVTLQSDSGAKEYLSYKLAFQCSNNEAEYEALILGLLAAREKGIKRLRIVGDSKLIILQSEGVYALKEANLEPYRATVQRLRKDFDDVSIIQKPRSENKFPDALATLGAKTEFEGNTVAIEIARRTEPSFVEEDKSPKDEDWREPIIAQIATGNGGVPMMALSQFTILKGELYFRGPQGWLARCINDTQAKEILGQIHEETCGENDIALYRRI
ncbi:hypothetical protein Vadar_002619 [Vaccinium darrowii]|uniref:Uncharacterized protein n=1 Tax=Vaccinium darrowii TaxID=229202 RepID=A0ACB7XWA6_9ERIC|nr:hypothetical protein Vadar_002619 [Vaccinium darrowii]